MTNEIMQARADAVNEMAMAIIVSIDKVLQFHGNDPANISIVVAAFARSADYLNYMYPEFRKTIVDLMSDEKLNRKADEVMKQTMETIGKSILNKIKKPDQKS